MTYAQAAAATAPWWGVPLIAGLFTVLGVAAAQVVAWTMDRRRARREDERRWLIDRRESYAAFLTAATKVHMVLWESWETGLERTTVRALAEEANARRHELSLIASEGVSDAAGMLFGHIVTLDHTFTNNLEGVEQRDDLAKLFQEKRQIFVSAARQDLGLHEQAAKSSATWTST